MNLIKLTKRNRDKYLQEFIELEHLSILNLKDALSKFEISGCFESYSIDNFFAIWEAYSSIIKPSDSQVKDEFELDDISASSLPICFAFFDWAKFRLWLNEDSLKLALGLSFYLGKVINNLNKDLNWTSYIDDESRSFMGKNHPIMMGKNIKSSPVDIVMLWSLQHLIKDEYFHTNKKTIINETFNKIKN